MITIQKSLCVPDDYNTEKSLCVPDDYNTEIYK
jgi:hypothetical protein